MFSLSRGDRHGVDFWETVRDCCLEAVRALVPISPPRGRRSRPIQRGATERRAWNERHYRTAGIRLRLRCAEEGRPSPETTFVRIPLLGRIQKPAMTCLLPFD